MRLLALLAAALLALPALADEALWKLLAAGGQVIFLRHATTTPGVGDPPGFRLEQCATQRNLSPQGRAEALRLGEALRAHRVPLDEVLSSPWCRCIETAELATGRAASWAPLSNLFGRPENAAGQVKALRARIGAYRGKGNLLLVSHGSTAAALTGLHPAQNEMFVLTPLGGDEFRLAGRIAVQ